MDKGKLNDIFNDASEAVLIFDSQASLKYINKAAQQLFRLTAEEIVSGSLLPLLEEGIRAKVQAFIQQSSPQQFMEEQADILTKNRSRIPANLLFSKIRNDSGDIHMLMVEPLFDAPPIISDEYKTLADSLSHVVSLYDDQGKCLYVNAAIRKVYDFRPSQYQLRGGFFGFIDPKERVNLLKRIAEDNQRMHARSSYNCRVQVRDKSTLKVEVQLRRMYDTRAKLYRQIVFEKPLEETQLHKTDPGPKHDSQKPVPMLLLDAQWRLTHASEGAATALGFSPAEQSSFFDLLHPEDLSLAMAEKEGAIQNGIISSERYLKLNTAHRTSLFRVVFDKFFDQHGHLAYAVVRLYPPGQEQQVSSGSSRYLKLLAKHVDDIVCFFQQDFSLEYVSPSVTQTLGYDGQALTGTSLFELIHPEDRDEVRAFLQMNSEERLHDFSCRFRQARGGYLRLTFDLRMLDAPPSDDKMLPFLALLRHVPRLRNIAEPAAFISSLSEQLNDALAVVSLPSLLIKQVNQPLLSLLKGVENEILGQEVTTLFEDSTESEDLLKSLQSTDRPFEKEMRCVQQTRQVYWGRVSVAFFTNGEQRHALLRLSDISKQKEREEQLKKAREEAEQTLRSREEFLSTMSHEIRTPLNAILGMTHLMLQGKPREDQVKLLQTLKFSGDSLTALINDVLDFSKIEAGKLEFARDDFNLREFLHNIKLTYKNLAQEKGLIFRTLLEEELPEVINGDVHRLGQILNNLLNNAIKFTEDGYVILSVYMEEEEESHYTLLFEVADTGIGISSEKQSVIFDAYQQASERTSRYFGGTGLGLSIVKKLVELSDGTVQVDSSEGQGTTFRVRLKYDKPARGNKPLKVSDKSFIHEFQPLDRLKVLYVEDVIPNQFLMEGLCDTWHIELDTALSGLEALEKVKSNHYDLILMDIYMPEMNGFEAAQEIRKLEDPHYQQIPILALSASISEETRRKIEERGMNDYISKPLDPKVLHQKLSQYARSNRSPVLEGNSSAWEEDMPLETIQPDTPDFSPLRSLYANDPEGYVMILEQIYKLSDESSVIIGQAIQQGQEKVFRSNVHKIMSYVRLMKLQGLQELLDKVKGHFEDHNSYPLTATHMLDKHFAHLMDVLEAEIQARS